MSAPIQAPGRRDRAKQDKLARITAAAAELFATHGVDEVTTQQIADRADVGAGTVFLYASTKAELLLLVQNDLYRAALEQGRRDAPRAVDAVEAVMAVLTPVIVCNRKQVDNGRAYLREILFGDHDGPHHRDALDLTQQSTRLIAGELHRLGTGTETACAVLATALAGILYLTLADGSNRDNPDHEMIDKVHTSAQALLAATPWRGGAR